MTTTTIETRTRPVTKTVTDEYETIDRLLTQYPEGILSIVCDTFDFFYVLTDILPKLKDKIMARNGKLVIRPDSGDPADIITGTTKFFLTEENAKKFKVDDNVLVLQGTETEVRATAEEKGAIELLWDIFGGTVNEAGFKELDSHIGLIYGDGMYKERIEDINARLKAKGFASTVWVAGLGSYFFQGNVTRDSFGSAVKATYVEVNGEGRNIFKDPITDDGTKKSATGRLAVAHEATGNLYLIQGATDEQIANSALQPVWENGKFLKTYSFAEVRENLKRTTGIFERNGSLS